MRRSRNYATAVMIGCFGLTACGPTTTQSTLTPHALSPGTAHVSVDGQSMPTERRVVCTEMQFWTTIDIGDTNSGLRAVIRNASGLTAESVSISNLGGFTGSYWNELDHGATVTADGATFTIRGTATGFTARNPSKRSTSTFQVSASC